ncbi:hypothetical protein [Kocuria arenosa]|uniref:hypothetical protein n=1 Tax=Kocuria arenosa TaxID=3071446 RepID=UPI003F6769CF
MGADSAPAPVTSTDAPAEAVANEAEVEKDLRESSDGVLTTIEELEAFQIIRAIVCGRVKFQRVAYRDAKSYCAVLLDDNNRKSIARLHFNAGQKYLGLFDEDEKETRHPIDTLEDIFQFSHQLRLAVERFAGATVK